MKLLYKTAIKLLKAAKYIYFNMLDLSSQDLGDHDIIKLASLLSTHPEITVLDLSHNKIGNNGAIALAKLTTIVSLKLAHNCIDDDGVIALANTKTITALDLSNNYLSDTGVFSLSLNDVITDLILNGNNFEVDYLICNFIAKKNFRYLGLRGCDISNDTLTALTASKYLIKLDLSENLINRYHLIDSGFSLRDTAITSFTFDHNNDEDGDLNCFNIVFDESNYKHYSYKHISFCNANLYDFSFIFMVPLAARNLKVTSLSLPGNYIGDVGAAILASNPYIVTLNLSYNNISDKGAVAFAKANNITSLDLSSNIIGNCGAVALSNGNRRFMVYLNLSNNPIGNYGVGALASSKIIIDSLDLFDTNISASGVEFLARSKNIINVYLNCAYMKTKQALATFRPAKINVHIPLYLLYSNNNLYRYYDTINSKINLLFYFYPLFQESIYLSKYMPQDFLYIEYNIFIQAIKRLQNMTKNLSQDTIKIIKTIISKQIDSFPLLAKDLKLYYKVFLGLGRNPQSIKFACNGDLLDVIWEFLRNSKITFMALNRYYNKNYPKIEQQSSSAKKLITSSGYASKGLMSTPFVPGFSKQQSKLIDRQVQQQIEIIQSRNRSKSVPVF